MEAEGVAETVFDITAIGEMEEIHVVAKDDEGGGRDRDLRHVIDLEASALV